MFKVVHCTCGCDAMAAWQSRGIPQHHIGLLHWGDQDSTKSTDIKLRYILTLHLHRRHLDKTRQKDKAVQHYVINSLLLPRERMKEQPLLPENCKITYNLVLDSSNID
jgi:hypothetical protein